MWAGGLPQPRRSSDLVLRRAKQGAQAALFSLFGSVAAQAHPHVFVDGGIDFRFGTQGKLEQLEVTWIYDAFETLYMLSAHEMGLNDQGGLDEGDRQELITRLSQWPEDFDGSAHLRIAGAAVALDWPQNLDVHLVEGRLKLTFTRDLDTPQSLNGQSVEAAFYESTYFFDFSITQDPQLLGPANSCTSQIDRFDPNSGDRALLDVLAKLSREETSDIPNVGEVFADRIILQCE